MLHPLSLFPTLFSYPFLAYFILRITVAFSILRIGRARRKKSYPYLAYVDFITGILVLIGLYTQGALIVVILLLIKEYYLDGKAGVLDSKEKTILGLIAVIAFALLFLGPGSFALDYPL
jgi:hypothetical protein